MAQSENTTKIIEQMDRDARLAEFQLTRIIDKNPAAANDVFNWMKKYYLTAGYTRLAKIMVRMAK